MKAEEIYGFGWQTDAECQEYACTAYVSDGIRRMMTEAADETDDIDSLFAFAPASEELDRLRSQWLALTEDGAWVTAPMLREMMN